MGAGALECASDSNSDSYRSVIDDLTIKSMPFSYSLPGQKLIHNRQKTQETPPTIGRVTCSFTDRQGL